MLCHHGVPAGIDVGIIGVIQMPASICHRDSHPHGWQQIQARDVVLLQPFADPALRKVADQFSIGGALIDRLPQIILELKAVRNQENPERCVASDVFHALENLEQVLVVLGAIRIADHPGTADLMAQKPLV